MPIFFGKKGGRFPLRLHILTPILIYMGVMLTCAVLDIGDAAKHIRVSFTFWGSALIYYLSEHTPKYRNRLVKFLLLLLAVNIVSSYLGLQENMRAARALTNAATTAEALEEDHLLAMKNIGSVYLYQGLVVLIPVWIFFIKKKVSFVRASLLLWLTVSIVMKASFGISFLLMIIALILSWFDFRNPLEGLFFLLCALIAVWIPWDAVTNELSLTVENEEIAKKLGSLSRFLTSGEPDSGIRERFELYTISAETFWGNWFGVGIHYSYENKENGIGYHSQLLDDLARYGISAFLFYFTFLTQYLRLLMKKWRKRGMSGVAFPIVIVYLGFLILNLAFRSAEESVILLFLLPGLPDILFKKRTR